MSQRHISQSAISLGNEREVLDLIADSVHICLGPAPRIIDCLEFRADLRYLDPVDELAFLSMECERLGTAASSRSCPVIIADAQAIARRRY